METSARNQLMGTVVSVSLGGVMAEVTIDVNGATVVAAITKESAERLGLAEGKSVVSDWPKASPSSRSSRRPT
jgi:molybdopterin-binding protein